MAKSAIRSFVERAKSSLIGHILFFQVFVAIPMFLLFAFLKYSDGALSLEKIPMMVLVVSAGALVVAVLRWYTIWVPPMHSGKKKK